MPIPSPLGHKSDLGGRRLPAEDLVAVREAPEALDHFDVRVTITAQRAAAIGIARQRVEQCL